MSSFPMNKKPYITLLSAALLLALLLAAAPLFQGGLDRVLAAVSYIVWHNVFEFSSIIIAICIFCVSYYSFEQNRNFRYLFLGSMLLLMAFIDFFHTMSYKGMPEFLVPCTTSNRATTFWIIARLVCGFGLLTASVIPVKANFRFNKTVFFIVPVLISAMILDLVTFYPGLLPPMYIEGEGLTGTKVVLEFVVMLLILFAIAFLMHEYNKTKNRLNVILSCALLVGIFSELSFTLYVDVYGIYNFLGHLLKFVMYFIIFRVIFIQNIKLPYTELSAAKDEIKNYADNLDKIVEQRTEQLNLINRKLLDDLEYARGIQMSMLPKTLPESPEVAFEAFYSPAEWVGGDFYNVFKIDDTKTGLYIGDVSGHGVSAAMLTVFLNQSIRTKKENAQGKKVTLPPSEVLSNLYLDFNLTNFQSDVYIVMLYGIFDHTTRDFTYASAGLNVPPMIAGASGEVTELLIKGFPVCKLPGSQGVAYQDSRIRLKSGDKLLFYTDGLIEAENPDKKIYSDARLKEQLRNNRDLDAPMLVKSLAEHVLQFIGDGSLRDDITFFIMEIK